MTKKNIRDGVFCCGSFQLPLVDRHGLCFFAGLVALVCGTLFGMGQSVWAQKTSAKPIQDYSHNVDPFIGVD